VGALADALGPACEPAPAFAVTLLRLEASTNFAGVDLGRAEGVCLDAGVRWDVESSLAFPDCSSNRCGSEELRPQEFAMEGPAM